MLEGVGGSLGGSMAGKTTQDCETSRTPETDECVDSQGESETDPHLEMPGTGDEPVNTSTVTNGYSSQVNVDNGKRASSGSAEKRRRKQQEDMVQMLISEAQAGGAISLDLNKRGLRKIPDELLTLTQLEYLYLEGNELKCLPENFFDCLANLKWLDLRNNFLTAMPSAYIGRHQCLRNLLLEGNQLRTLPLELGLVSTLNGLNIAKNPLEFPPQDIIEGGTAIILAFFRHMLDAKSQGRIPTVPRLEDLKLQDSDEEEEELRGRPSSKWRRSGNRSSSHSSQNSALRRHQIMLQSGQQPRFSSSEYAQLVGPVPVSAALHKPTSFYELRTSQLERFKRAGAMGTWSNKVHSKSGKQKKSKVGYHKLGTLGRYPDPPPPERVDERYMEERRLAKLRVLKEKQDMLLQKRRDQDMLGDWRTEGKRMQREKDMKRRIQGRIEFEEPAKQAPFAVADDHMRVPSNTERIAQDVKAKHEKIRSLSPTTMYQLEEARANRDRELEKRIKMHTLSMHERRRQPKGTPQEEMLAAKRELEIAEQLQIEIEARRKNLEYRFTAFTGNTLPY